MKKLIIIIIVFGFIIFSGCNKKEKAHDHQDHENEKHEIADSDEDSHNEESEEHEDDDYENDEHDKKNAINLSDEIIKEVGIKISSVKKERLKKLIKLPGEIVLNQDTLQHLFPRFSGLVKKVYKRTGDRVKNGDILALIQNNETLSTYEVKALLPGTIIKKHITVGEVAKENDEIYVIANLSIVWVHLDIYAKDEPYLKTGQTMTIETIGSKMKAEGRISYISPVYSKETRTLTARIVLPNYNGRWRPGTFVKGYKHVTISKAVLVVPKDAVQIVEQKSVVFIPLNKNSFKPIHVILGASDEEFVHIKSGLKMGDKIVSNGAFELKAQMVTRSMGGHAGHGH